MDAQGAANDGDGDRAPTGRPSRAPLFTAKTRDILKIPRHAITFDDNKYTYYQAGSSRVLLFQGRAVTNSWLFLLFPDEPNFIKNVKHIYH